MLAGKTALVLGVANKHSIAWGVAQAWHAAGARVVLGVQSERFVERATDLATAAGWPVDDNTVVPCDVTRDEAVDAAFEAVAAAASPGGGVSTVLHSVAHAPRAALRAPLSQLSRDDFAATMDVSVYSLVAVARALARVAPPTTGASLTAMTFVGGDRVRGGGGDQRPSPVPTAGLLVQVVPSYGVMGPAKACLQSCAQYLAEELGPTNIRVNCISAGPINTLAARGLPNFSAMADAARDATPLPHTAQQHDVGAAATFLASDAARCVTAQTLYVDGGCHAL